MKPYTWNEIKSFLGQDLKKTKHIMTFGTIGSLNIKKEIDIIITKKPLSKSSDFYKEIHAIYDSLDTYLRKTYKSKLVRFYNLTDKNFLEAFKVAKDKDLLMHTMVYQSLPQLEIDWITPHVDAKEMMKTKYNCLIGSPEELFNSDFSKKKLNDGYYNLIYHCDKTSSNMAEEKMVKFMNGFFEYIFEKILKEKQVKGKNKEEIRNIFYNIIDLLDKLNGEQPA